MPKVAFCAALLSACAMSSKPMDAGDGTYLISGDASAVRDGATGLQAQGAVRWRMSVLAQYEPH